MKVELLNKMIEKAKTKKNGVYSVNGSAYRVQNNKVTHVVEWNEILAFSHGFLVHVGTYDAPYKAVKALKNLPTPPNTQGVE